MNQPDTSQSDPPPPPTGTLDWLLEDARTPPPPGRAWVQPVLLALVIVTYAAIQWRFFTPACRETDTAGYVWLAERLALGLPVAVTDDPFRYLSHVWVQGPDGLVLPKYTLGLSMLMAIGIRLAGTAGPYLVSPVCGALCLLAMWWLCRLWMSPWASFCATATLALGNMYLMYTGYPLAHAANTCFVTWGMVCLFRWYHRQSLPLAIGAGLCLGIAPAIRPTSVLLWPVAIGAVALVLHRQWCARGQDSPAPAPRLWPSVLGMAIAGAIVPVLCLVYNSHHFGSPFNTGYDLSGEQYGFTWGAWPAIMDLLKGLLANGPAVVAGLGILAIVIWPDHRERLLLLLWLLPLPVVYGIYYWSLSNHGAMVTRFLFCLFPLLVAAAFGGIYHLLHTRRKRFWVPLATALIAIGIDAPAATRNMHHVVAAPDLRQQALAVRQILPHLQDGAVVLGAEPLVFHLGAGHNLQLYSVHVFDPGTVLHEFRRRRPGDPRQQPSRIAAITSFYTQHQEDLPQLEKQFIRDQLAAGRQVAFAVPESYLRREQARLGNAFTLTALVTWSQPRVRWQRGDDGTWTETPYEEPWALYNVQLAEPADSAPPSAP